MRILYSRACVYVSESSAMVTIAGGHTRVVEVVCQGETRFRLDDNQSQNNDDPLAVLSTTTLSQIASLWNRCRSTRSALSSMRDG